MERNYQIPMDLKLNPIIEQYSEMPIIHNIYDMLIQEIDILFTTDDTEILCSNNDWANLKQYVFKTSVSEGTLTTRLEKLIYNECPSAEGIDISVDVKFYHGSVDDIGVITVTIRDNMQIVNEKQYYVG